jgi:N-acetylglucosaminyldiphosphoundecaprenol N-acetyl-beta-D-mannosaminyltransferase
MENPPRINILGVGIHAVDLKKTVSMVLSWIDSGESYYMSHCNVHTIMSCERNPLLGQAVRGADLVVPDGMPLVWIGRIRGYAQIGRVYGPDHLIALCKESQNFGHRHFFYGGSAGVAFELGEELKRRFPKISIAGTHSPPFRPLTAEEDAHEVDMINNTTPDIVWVGLGTPKQDVWAANRVNLLHNTVIIPVGAAFDFITNRVPQAPRWMQHSGLEWLFRLISEPRRLWRRYLIDNPLFILRIMRQGLGLKRYTLD